MNDQVTDTRKFLVTYRYSRISKKSKQNSKIGDAKLEVLSDAEKFENSNEHNAEVEAPDEQTEVVIVAPPREMTHELL